MHINTFFLLEMFKVMKIIRRELFFNLTSLVRLPLWCHALCENLAIQNTVFSKSIRTRNFYIDLFLGHLQPGVD